MPFNEWPLLELLLPVAVAPRLARHSGWQGLGLGVVPEDRVLQYYITTVVGFETGPLARVRSLNLNESRNFKLKFKFDVPR